MSTGLNLTRVPFMTRSYMSDTPDFSSLLNSATSTIPLSTATPNKAINPTPAEMLKGISLIKRAQTPPIADKGIAVKIKKLCLTDPNVKYNKTRIRSNAIGTTIANLLLARCKFSNCPP